MSKSNESFVNRVTLAPFLHVVGRDNAKRIIMSVVYGLLIALQEGKISVTEAENMVFNPDILLQCQKLSMDKQVIELIEYGMELSDIEEIVADEVTLQEAIVDCLKLLNEIPLPVWGRGLAMSPQIVGV